MFIEAPGEGVSTCSSDGLERELIERTHDYVIGGHNLARKDQEYGSGGRLRTKTTQGGHFLGGKRERMAKCRKHYQDSVVELPDEAKLKKDEQKRKKGGLEAGLKQKWDCSQGEELVSQVLMKEEEATKVMKKSEVEGWSTEKMYEKASKQEFKRHGRNGAMEEHRSRRN